MTCMQRIGGFVEGIVWFSIPSGGEQLINMHYQNIFSPSHSDRIQPHNLPAAVTIKPFWAALYSAVFRSLTIEGMPNGRSHDTFHKIYEASHCDHYRRSIGPRCIRYELSGGLSSPLDELRGMWVYCDLIVIWMRVRLCANTAVGKADRRDRVDGTREGVGDCRSFVQTLMRVRTHKIEFCTKCFD